MQTQYTKGAYVKETLCRALNETNVETMESSMRLKNGARMNQSLPMILKKSDWELQNNCESALGSLTEEQLSAGKKMAQEADDTLLLGSAHVRVAPRCAGQTTNGMYRNSGAEYFALCLTDVGFLVFGTCAHGLIHSSHLTFRCMTSTQLLS